MVLCRRKIIETLQTLYFVFLTHTLSVLSIVYNNSLMAHSYSHKLTFFSHLEDFGRGIHLVPHCDLWQPQFRLRFFLSFRIAYLGTIFRSLRCILNHLGSLKHFLGIARHLLACTHSPEVTQAPSRLHTLTLGNLGPLRLTLGHLGTLHFT